ncbi:MAG: hypothetical protein ACRDRZ_09225 [Pseudonocardiaceae bacterium]
MTYPNFAQQSRRLAAFRQEQRGLQAAVAAGELWMEAGVAERAAKRCERGFTEVEEIIDKLRPLGREFRFGENDHGRQVAKAFKNAAVGDHNSVTAVLRESQHVLRDMAQTFREAGRAVEHAERTNEQDLGGG